VDLPESTIREIVERYCDFIEQASTFPRSEWLSFISIEPKFEINIYTRKGTYLIPNKSGMGMRRSNCLVLANITITPMGEKVFTQVLDLLITVCNSYKLPIVVELVHNKRLRHFLKRNNFLEYSTGALDSSKNFILFME